MQLSLLLTVFIIAFVFVILVFIASEDFREWCGDFFMNIAEDIAKRIVAAITASAIAFLMLITVFTVVQSNATQPVQHTVLTPITFVTVTPQKNTANPTTTENTMYLPFVSR